LIECGGALRRATTADLPAIAALQREAYAVLTARIGRKPMPVDADFARLLETMEIWVSDGERGLDAVLILDPKEDHLLIWSIAVAERRKGQGLGRDLIAFAERRAAGAGAGIVRLFTNERFTENLSWYARQGYGVERVEDFEGRRIVHLAKPVR
jgi:ribosomal protein S18 acetylase RimI-like enzyme